MRVKKKRGRRIQIELRRRATLRRKRARGRKVPRRRLEDYERLDHTRGAGRDLLGVDLD